MDCLRADHVGFLGYGNPTTPFLDSLAKESLVLAGAIATGTPTYHAFPAIMASRYPLALGRDLIGLTPQETTLASALREAGYSTGAFVAANPYISRRYGYDLGFETFQDFLDVKTTTITGNGNHPNRFNVALKAISRKFGPLDAAYDELSFQYGLRKARRSSFSFDQLRRFPAADFMVNKALDWLTGVSTPFFLWLHFMDPHAPYYPLEMGLRALALDRVDSMRACDLNSYWNRAELSLRRARKYRNKVMALYDAGIRSVDEQIARFVSALQKAGIWNNCIFAFTADHGEEFLEHGGRFHFPPKVTEELVRVPLLIHDPKNRKEHRCPGSFGLLDLPPTLLGAVGTEAPASFSGRNRWADIQRGKLPDDPVITECCHHNPSVAGSLLDARILSLREAQYKLVLDFRNSREVLFNLEEDATESRPLPDDAEIVRRRRLLDRARAHVSDSLQTRDMAARAGLLLRETLAEKNAVMIT